MSKISEKFFPYMKLRTQIVVAQLLNQAGIVGAAMYAKTKLLRIKKEDGQHPLF